MLIRAIILSAVIIATVLACRFSPEVTGGKEAGIVMSLPMSLPGFTAEKGGPEAIEKKLLPDDTEFAKATYTSKKGDIAYASIVLSGAQRNSIHRPEVCLQGQGWTLMGSRDLPIEMPDGRTLTVKDLYIEKPITLHNGTKRDLRAHYLYWFVGTDVSTPSHGERLWLTLWDNVTRNINHRWAYPSLMSVVTDNFQPGEIGQPLRSNEETIHLLVDLIKETAPKFQKSLMP